MQYVVDEERCRDLDWSSRHEWLLTDGAGGYAMGTVSGLNTRRYHGHLVAAGPDPADRLLLLDSIEAFADFSGTSYGLSTNAYPGAIHPTGYRHLRKFTSDSASVEWTFAFSSQSVVKRLSFSPGAARISYRNEGSRSIRLSLRPLVAHKPHHTNFVSDGRYPSRFLLREDGLDIGHNGIDLGLEFPGAYCHPIQGWYYRFEHAREADRGLDPRDDLFCPCELTYELEPGDEAVLEAHRGSSRFQEQASPSAQVPLVEAAGRFLVETPTRTSIIAGYPWFADWGRDTMISLPGVCLTSGRLEQARRILSDYASQIRQGLIPNRFVESHGEPDYNTADASLWFVNAAYRTLEAEWDEPFARAMAIAIQEIVDWHRVGTSFGIRMDAEDGLITQGVAGSQLTWMDAKIGDWVVTPRHGKPVEVNGLWINALRVLAWLKERCGGDASPDRTAADEAEEAFHRKFWSLHHGWYNDTVDPYDAQLRPNQLIPLALPFGPLDPHLAESTLLACETHLLTDVGLRSLAPFEIHYHGRFEGPLHELDSAYHQGTIWPWLLGVYWQAHRRVRGSLPPIDLASVEGMLEHQGLGGIAECYDGDAPHRPGGCPWQAWSVATLAEALYPSKVPAEGRA